MAGRVQTSIQVPACVIEALQRIQSRQDTSREAAVCDVLTSHVEHERAKEEPDRLTHISTVLRHPLRPFRPHPFWGPDLCVRLSMRLPPELIEEARDISLVLPGQPSRGGVRDYQARPLTDAVVTAIAAVEPFSDEVLDGLRPCIRHQAARGLWRLAVAATLTQAEHREVIAAWEAVTRDPSDAAALRVLEIFREGNTAWHDQWRLAVLRHLAQKLLRQDADHEKMLYAQHDGGPWAQLRDNLESDGLDHVYFAGFEGWALNMEGRGGSHLWRVKRQVTLEGLLRWLLDSTEEQPRADPRERLWPAAETSETEIPEAEPPTAVLPARTPDWGLGIPPGWEPVVLSQLDPLPPKARKIADDGKALLLESYDPPRRFLWPMRRRSPDGPLAPVPGIDTVLSVLLPATQVGAPPARADSTARSFIAVHAAELILTRCEERSRCIQPLQFMPAHIAHRAGLIDLSTRDALVEKARADTQRNMRQFADALAHHRPHPRIPALLDATTSPTEFRKIAFSIGLPDPFGDWIDHVQEKPVFAWSVSSLADQVARGASPLALEWLARQLLREYRRELKADRLRAWQEAFDHNRVGHGRWVWGRRPGL
jgi:hypothetical protein